MNTSTRKYVTYSKNVEKQFETNPWIEEIVSMIRPPNRERLEETVVVKRLKIIPQKKKWEELGKGEKPRGFCLPVLKIHYEVLTEGRKIREYFYSAFIKADYSDPLCVFRVRT